MWTQITYTAVYAILFLALFGFGELCYRVFKLRAELTRKIVHIGTGIICLTFPFYLTSHWSVLFLTICFFLILFLSIKWNKLQSINGVDRVTRGSFLYPLSVYLSFWSYSILNHQNFIGQDIMVSEVSIEGVQNSMYYFLPIMILAFSDPIAAIVGKKFPMGRYSLFGNQKTLSGSTAFFIVTLLLSILFYGSMETQVILTSLLIAFVSTVSEAIANKGYDNIFIPVSIVLTLLIIQ